MLKFYFNFRMDDVTRRQLIFLSKSLQRTKSNLLRWLVHQECLRQGFQHLDGMIVPSTTAESDEGVDG